MSTTTTSGRTPGLNGSAVPAARTGAAPLRVQARGPRPPAAAVALSVLLMLGCGAAAGAAVLGKDPTTPVIVAARALPAGTVIKREDLKAADLGGSGLAAIRASQGGTLLGRTTVGPIPAGTLINSGMVATDPPPAAGQVAVGLALVPGQLPAGQLTAGRLVTVYELPSKDAQGAAGGTGATAGGTGSTAGASGSQSAKVLVDQALVLSVAPSGSGGTLVNVIVAQQVAPQLAAASFAGQVGVGLLPLGTR